MAIGALFILYVVIAFSFAVTSIFMFIPRGNETVHNIFFCLAIALGILVTIIDATSLPSNYTAQIVIAWFGLLPAAIGIIIAAASAKVNAPAKIFVMLTSVYGALGYFLFL